MGPRDDRDGGPASRRAAAVLAGFVAGFAGGLFGVGGGIVLVPMLTGMFRVSQHQAHGTSLAVITATALSGIVVYALHGHVAWMPAVSMAVASVFTARLGARWAARTRREWLMRAFAAFVLLTALRLLWRPPAVTGGPLMAGLPGFAAALAVGAPVGLLAGFLGVGGGILVVPALTLLFGMPQQTAQGTSLALMLATAPAGALEHHRHGNVHLRLAPALALGAVLGAPIASLLVQRLSQPVLVRAFALFLVANAVQTWLRAARTLAGPGREAR